MKIALAVAFMALMGTAYAYVYIAPIYTGAAGRGCVQPNATYISCPDGSNITVAVTVSAPDTPLLGNYTVWQVGNRSRSLAALTGTNGQGCEIGYGQSAICFISIAPFSAFSGNETSVENITLRLIPSRYPQSAYTQNISITVQHTLSANGLSAVSAYQSAYSQYSLRSNAYAYACSGYALCNSTIQGSIASIGGALSGAYNSILVGDYQNSMFNVSLAAAELKDSNSSFNAFESTISAVVKDVIAGRSYIANAADAYVNNTAALNNCSSSNHTTAGEYLAGKISEAESEPQPISADGAKSYEEYASGLSDNVSRIVSSCVKSGTFAASAGFSLNLGNLVLGSAAEYIIIAIVIVIAMLYIRSALVTRSEIRRIRGDHDSHGTGAQHGEPKNPGGDSGGSAEKAGTDSVEHVDKDDYVQKISKGDER
ncbi:MAG: hypothetical protein M1321_00345 [Candidatus Marsarchaeota archaeon]|nr:hypothetical protein [Candidatus Marsarchaeota archaeon]